MINFFTPEEGNRIVEAIREAEKNTSGEIRVHLEANCKGETMKTAQKTFKVLGMKKTTARNGVLFFIVPERKNFVILGDEGINSVVPPHFWEDIKEVLQQCFREGQFEKGITQGIQMVGEKLKAYFPYDNQDTNELPDEISCSN